MKQNTMVDSDSEERCGAPKVAEQKTNNEEK